jgi:hypothetical protein
LEKKVLKKIKSTSAGLVRNQYQKNSKGLSGHGAKTNQPGKLLRGMKKIFLAQNI